MRALYVNSDLRTTQRHVISFHFIVSLTNSGESTNEVKSAVKPERSVCLVFFTPIDE